MHKGSEMDPTNHVEGIERKPVVCSILGRDRVVRHEEREVERIRKCWVLKAQLKGSGFCSKSERKPLVD